jgi:cellulose synthase/poly-beta-1,6-N-acetylglucosamine synthase-like glycosyltransferase
MDMGAAGLYVCLFIALYFEVFLLISFLEKRPSKKNSIAPARYPSVSMLVPCFNEQRTVGSTIESLLALDYPREKLEIVVIDDGSSDNTAKVAREYAERYPSAVTFLQKENGGKYTALNLGIERSRGEIIGCLDADSFAAKDALMEAVKRFESDKTVMAITPAMKVHEPKKLLELMQNVEYTFGIFYKKMFDNLSAINVLPGPFSLYRREVFNKIGLFKHAHNTEDMEIAFRMHANNLRIVNAHTALVYTTVPTTVRTLLKQRVRWSQGFLQNARDYRFMFLNRKFGNFGMLVLPFGIVAFFAGIYSSLYLAFSALSSGVRFVNDRLATGIPLNLVPSAPKIDLFFLNTDMMVFIVAAVLSLTIVAIILGSRIANVRIGLKSYFAYFAFFGFLAPLWLIKAAWGAVLARESAWR